MTKMTAGEFRNYQFNEAMRVARAMFILLFFISIAFMFFTSEQEILEVLKVFRKYPMTFGLFASIIATFVFFMVYLATKEQANNKHWFPTEDGPPNNFRTQGVMK